MKRYGIRITLPPGDTLLAGHLLGEQWESHRWYDTADERDRAYEQMLANRDVSVKKEVLMQVAVPSREAVPDYASLREHVEWSLDVVSPRVGAHAALHFGRFRLEVGLHTEYLLRLMGDDFAIRGVDFALRFDLENGAAKRKAPR